MPPQNRTGSDDRGHLAQAPTSQAFAAGGQTAALVIGELQPSADLAPAKPDSPLLDTR